MRLRIARLGDTAVYLHAGVLLAAVYMLTIRQGILLAVGMSCATLHEGAHALTAWALGHPPGEIELTPMGAVMRLREEERLPAGKHLAILAAGPALTLLLCVFSLRLTAEGTLPLSFGRMLCLNNLAMLMVNLLPAMPLDGGAMLLTLLRCVLREDAARSVLRAISSLLGLGCIGLNLWLSWRWGGWNLSLACAGCFMIYGGETATRSNALHELQGFLDRRIRLETQGCMAVHEMVGLESIPLRQAVLRLHPRRYTFLLRVRADMKNVALLTEEQLIDGYLRFPGGTLADIHEARPGIGMK